MLTSRRTTLKPLLESNDGVHLTAYLVNRGDLADLKTQLTDVISESHEWLSSAMNLDEREKFLEPLSALLIDARILEQMKGNIGLFRSERLFRILNIPIEVKQGCQVATSFHVKPLLRWLQTDREFLLLGLEGDSAHLYFGSQESLKHIDSILFPEIFKHRKFFGGYFKPRPSRKRRRKEEQTLAWLREWIIELTKNSQPKFFVAGEKSQVESFNRKLKYPQAVKSPVADYFSQESVGEIASRIRALLKEESKVSIEKALLEFRFAEGDNRTKKNLFQISKAVVEGRVRKLIVTDELSIFGRIDPKSGGLALHPFDMDHEDDDVLDDLAQMVLSQGGEVVIAKQDEIPKGRPILAILDDESQDAEMAEAPSDTEIRVSLTGRGLERAL